MQLVGDVKGHEQKVMQFLQQHLQNNNIALSVSLQPGQEHLAVTVLFHRVKPRLPTDELQSLLSAGDASTVQHHELLTTIAQAMVLYILYKPQQAIS